MNNISMQNFTGYTTYAQNAMHAPTPVRTYGYNANVSKSPDFCATQGGYSPLKANGMCNYGYVKPQSPAPVTNMMQWAGPIENSIYEITEYESTTKTPTLKLRKKLSCRSKAFVVKDIRDRNDRKTSSDTKAHTEDEGNTSDDSEDSLNGTQNIIHPVLRKCSTVGTANVTNSTTLPPTEKAQTAFKVKFKTELCKNWQVGDCKFGTKCAFAHGFEELSEKRNLPNNYKTKICKQFHEEMYCTYGARCQFVHHDIIEKDSQDSFNKAIFSTVGLNLSKRTTEGRLSVFKNLSQ
jgi:hypothetical protein